MTIDERIERLTERHEALAQSVELLTHTVQDLATSTNENIGRVLDVVESLARTAKSHEDRIDNLERRRPS